jgi:hypothetical protein
MRHSLYLVFRSVFISKSLSCARIITKMWSDVWAWQLSRGNRVEITQSHEGFDPTWATGMKIYFLIFNFSQRIIDTGLSSISHQFIIYSWAAWETLPTSLISVLYGFRSCHVTPRMCAYSAVGGENNTCLWPVPSTTMIVTLLSIACALSLVVSADRNIVSHCFSCCSYTSWKPKTVINNCNDTIWPAYSDSDDSQQYQAGGFQLVPGSKDNFSLKSGWVGNICWYTIAFFYTLLIKYGYRG